MPDICIETLNGYSPGGHGSIEKYTNIDKEKSFISLPDSFLFLGNRVCELNRCVVCTCVGDKFTTKPREIRKCTTGLVQAKAWKIPHESYPHRNLVSC